MRRLLGYLVVLVLAALFTVWYWNWGLQQGPVSSTEEVPGIFNISNIVLSIAFFGSGWLVLRKNLKHSLLVLACLFVWYLLVVILGRLGFFAMRPFFVPNIIFAFIVLFIAGKVVLSLPFLQAAFDSIPLEKIFLVQTFRVLGVAFLAVYAMKVLPGQFAIPTGVGDVVAGLTAPVVAYIYALKKPYSKMVAVIWNWAGILDLAMAITLGILTYPEPLKILPTEIPNLPIALYPLVIIPLFAVPFSVLLHIFSLKTLKKN